jgi:Kef-type K+ transport system membrane component KefB
MNELSSLGLILLFALAAGHLVKFLKVPEVTGYILAGVAVGPSGLGWVSHENLAALEVFSEVALGLILFSIGSIFELRRVRQAGPTVLRITAAESILAAFLVSSSMLALGQQWQVALLLGAVAMATAPASTLMVVRERNAAGPMTDTLVGVIGVNNLFCLTAFAIAAMILDLSMAGSGEEVLGTLYRSGYLLVWEMIGSAALGFLVGLLLAAWATRVTEHGEVLILFTGCVLLCVGAAMVLDLSTLIASLAVGATMANLSAHTRRVLQTIGRSDPPFYAIFFVIAGADLDMGRIQTLGVVGIVYVLARATGKVVGARYSSERLGMHISVQRYLGLGLMAQAGLAIGLAIAVDRQYPEFAPAVNTVVLAAVTISEIIGPIAARIAIDRSGEARPHEAEVLGD